MEIDDFDEENLEHEEEEDLEAFSDSQTDEEIQDSIPSVSVLGSADLRVAGVRRYKKADQKARLTTADAKIKETQSLLKKLEASLSRKDSDPEVKEKEKYLLNQLEMWKREKTQARNAVNQRRRQLRLRQTFGTEKQTLLDEKDREFATMYMEAYAALEEGYCEHLELQYNDCHVCYARILFGNLTCLTIEADNAYEESQRPSERKLFNDKAKIVASSPEEVKKMKKERTRDCLRAFRERQKKKVLGMDQRMKFFEEAYETFRIFYKYMSNTCETLSILNDEETRKGQPYMINCVRQFAETVEVPLPKYNIHLESERFLEFFMDYLAETFLLLLRHPLGFEEVQERQCVHCDQIPIISEEFHHFIQDLPDVDGVKQFSQVIEAYEMREEFVDDCPNCSENNTLKVSRYFTNKRSETKYLLICIPKGNVIFPRTFELIFDVPMELIWFVTKSAHICRPCKKIDRTWYCQIGGNWKETLLPVNCDNVPYVVFRKRLDLLI